MKADVVGMGGSKGRTDFPTQFNEPIRPDLIKRAVESIWGNKRQPYGAFPRAGKQAAAKLSRRRRDYKTSYGYGISRVPRKVLSRRGTRFTWVGAFAPGTVGGRQAHPPKAEKIWTRKINRGERRKAIRSALAATLIKELVQKRGHKVPMQYPIILESTIEGMKKTKEVLQLFHKIGLQEELQRVAKQSMRTGKGKMRGRLYRTRKGPLLVVSKECPLLKAAQNVLGVDIEIVNHINAELLAPGAEVGRLTYFTQAALEHMQKEQMFTDAYQGPQPVKAVQAPKAAKKVKGEASTAKPAAPKHAKETVKQKPVKTVEQKAKGEQ